MSWIGKIDLSSGKVSGEAAKNAFYSSRCIINENNINEYLNTRLGVEFMAALKLNKKGAGFKLWSILASNGRNAGALDNSSKKSLISLFNKFHLKYIQRDLASKHVNLVLNSGVGYGFLREIKTKRADLHAKFISKNSDFSRLDYEEKARFKNLLVIYFKTGTIPSLTAPAKNKIEKKESQIYGRKPPSDKTVHTAAPTANKPLYSELRRVFWILLLEECANGSDEDKAALYNVTNTLLDQSIEIFLAPGTEDKLRELNTLRGKDWAVVSSEKIKDYIVFRNPNIEYGVEYVKKTDLIMRSIKNQFMSKQVFRDMTMTSELFDRVIDATLKQLTGVAAFKRAHKRFKAKYGQNIDIAKESFRSAAGDVGGGIAYGLLVEFPSTMAQSALNPAAIPAFAAAIIGSREGLSAIKGEFLQVMQSGDTFDKAAYITLNVATIATIFAGARHSILAGRIKGARSAKLGLRKLQGEPEMYSLIIDDKKALFLTKEQAVMILQEHQKGGKNSLGKVEIYLLNPDGTIKPAPREITCVTVNKPGDKTSYARAKSNKRQTIKSEVKPPNSETTISGDASNRKSSPKIHASKISGRFDLTLFSKGNNLIYLQNAKEICPEADIAFNNRPIRLAIAGYSAPPTEAYAVQTSLFLEKLINKLGGNKVGIVTSPTASTGSIDAIGTTVAHKRKLPILYITANDYVPYIDPDKFPKTINKDIYSKARKYVFPNPAEYSKATAEASNLLLVTGGRDATIADFVNAISKGNKVIILDEKILGGVNWDGKSMRPQNAAKYLIEQIEAFKANKELPYPDCKGFSRKFLQDNKNAIENFIEVVTIHNETEIPLAAEKSLEFLTNIK